MNVTAKTYLVSLFVICFFLPSFSANIAIIESQSYHPLHKMDLHWQSTAQRLGHGAEIFDKSSFDNPTAFCDHDIIVISSGLTELNATQRMHLIQYIQSGINVYVQAEYLMSNPGNILYKELVAGFGGQFDWMDENVGNLSPMQVMTDIGSTPNNNLELTYFWYGVSGIGDHTIMPFLQYDNKNYGFVFSSPAPSYGKVMCITDQDWIRSNNNPAMLENMLTYFLDHPADTSMPDILISVDEEMPCPGTILTFTASTSFPMPATTFQWMKNGVDISGENSNVYITAELQFGDVIECRLERQLLCDQRSVLSNPILVAVHNPLSASMITIEVSDTSICAGEDVLFTLRPSDYPDAQNIQLQWMINGQPVAGATDSTFVASYLSDNNFVNCLFTYDDRCDPGKEILSEAITIQVTPMVTPTANLMADKNDICPGETITFSILGQNLGTQPQIEWLINGTNTNIYTNSPFFMSSDLEDGDLVSCSITVDRVCTTQPTVTTQTMVIQVVTPLQPVASITSDLSDICEGTTVTFTATGQNLGTAPAYQWLIDGKNVGDDSPIFSSPILSNTQQISCIITSSENCVTSSEVVSNLLNINTRPLLEPTVSIRSNQTSLCSGAPITFTATGNHWGSNPSFQWLVNGQDAGTNANSFINTLPAYGQQIVCIVSSDAECLSSNVAQSETIEIMMSDLAVSVLEAEGEHCGDSNGLIEVEGTGGIAPYTYLWSEGSTDNYLSDLSSASYTITITDANGCTTSKTIEIDNISGPIIQSVEAIMADCDDRSGSARVVLTGNIEELTFRWTNEAGELVGLNPTVNNLPSGRYTIGVIDAYGCSATDTVSVQNIADLSVHDLEVPFLTLGEETVLNPIAYSSQQLSYEWSPANGLSCTDCPNPVANPLETTVYTLTISNEYGCMAISKVVVKVLPNRDVYIPNAFSPNQDGVNDYFTIFGGNHVNKVRSLKVIDRWGSVLFEKNNFDINDETLGWNGSLRGKTMGAGVYVYIAEIEFIDGESKWVKGDISITP